MMNEGPSFSFLSQSSQKYPPLSFNSLERLESNKNLDSLIEKLPKNNSDMRDKVQIVLLLQAAEIERLSLTLDAYKSYFDQLSGQSKDYSQGNPSAHHLSNGSISRFNQSFPTPNALKEGSQGSILDQNKYLQKLESKYKRALKYIEIYAAARTQLQSALTETKEELTNTQTSFQAFKRSSIRQYQLLREELDNSKRGELSFQIREINTEKQRMRELLSNKQFELMTQREKFQSLLATQKSTLSSALGEVERLMNENEEYRRSIEKAELKHREVLNEKENSLTLAGLEMERLNAVIREKTARFKQSQTLLSQRMTASRQEINLLQREVERGKQKIGQLQQQLSEKRKQIEKLEKSSASLHLRISEIGAVSEKNTTEIRLKESRLTSQLKNLSEVLSKSQENFTKEIQHYKSVNTRLTTDLSKAQETLNSVRQALVKNEHAFTSKIQELTSELQAAKKEKLISEDKERRTKDELKLSLGKWDFQRKSLERKIEELNSEKRRELEMSQIEHSGFLEKSKKFYTDKMRQMESRIGEYEERLRKQHQIQLELSTQNNSLKAALQQSQKSKSTIMRNRSFEQLFQQIQNLCSSVKQKESYIESLKQEISSLNESSRKHFHETLNLREMLTKLLSLVQLLEHTRKEDQQKLAVEMRLLFDKNSHLMTNVLQAQETISTKQKTETEYSQFQLLKTKDSEILTLKDRIEQLQHHATNQQTMDQVINKAIALTKDNSELKIALSKQQAQIQHLTNLHKTSITETQEQQQRFNVKSQQKEEEISKIKALHTQSAAALLEEQQKTIKLESLKRQLELLNKNQQQELAIREGVISDLKASLQFKNQQNTKTSSAMEEEIRRCSQLNDQINQLRKTYNYQLANRTEELQVTRAENQNIQKHLKTLNCSLQEKEQTIRILQESIHAQEAQLTKVKETQNFESQKQECSRVCLRCLNLEKNAKDWEAQRKDMRAEIKILKAEQKAFIEEQGSRVRYSEKIPVLNGELSRLESVIEELKLRNSQLVMTNHELSIKVEQQHFNKQKIAILNKQLERLQNHNVDLLEEVNAYRLEICQEATNQKNVQEVCALLVMLSAEVESLREGSLQKERELTRLRKTQIGS